MKLNSNSQKTMGYSMRARRVGPKENFVSEISKKSKNDKNPKTVKNNNKSKNPDGRW